MKQELEIPSGYVKMVCNRDYRLSSLSGNVVNFQANVPVLVHPFAYKEAVAIGAVMAEDEPEVELGAGPQEQQHKVHESVAQAAKLEHEAKMDAIERTIVKLFEADDQTLFKADGYPKYQAVIERIDQSAGKVSAQEIQEVFDDMRDDVNYAELMGA